MVGQNIGKYRVLDRVGRGGMGTVYRAIDETLHREVAIKVLNAELNDPEVARRFRAEAITVARLSHPGIATIYELFQHEGQWLMVMEFLRGETLEHVVSRRGALEPERAAILCMQSLAALAHAHSMAVVHRDLKPANIMLTESGDIKIMDFGIARVTGTEHLTNVGFMMGTPAYMAPEQVLGQEIDARADLYAIGVVLFRLVTGQLPFKGDSPFAMAQAQVNATPTPVSTLRDDLPPWVDEVVRRAMAKAPAERFQSAMEFHDALERVLTGAPTPTHYRSAAPAGLVSTPPRAMPTGSIEAATPTTRSDRIPVVPTAPFDPAGVAPTIAAPTPVMLERPTHAAPPPLPPSTPPVATAPPPIEPPRAPAVKAAASRTKPAALGVSATAVATLAALLLLVAAGGAWWLLSRRSAEPPATIDAAVEQQQLAEPEPEPEPAEPPPIAAVTPQPAPPRPSPPPATAAAATPARGTATAPSEPAPGAGREGRATGPARGGEPPAAPAPPVDTAPPATVTNVKFMVIDGRKADDQDVTLNFADGQISAVAVRGGGVLATLPYESVASATYVHARSPRWDASFASPPDDLDVGGVFRSARHWLMLQNAGAYTLLRLEDINVIRVIREIEARTGVRVRRPTSND